MVRSILAAALAVVTAAKCPLSGGSRGDLPNPHTPQLHQSLPPETVPDITYEGCVCKTTCGATVEQDNATCDWCYTSSNCGRASPMGTWDYCDFTQIDESYENQTAAAKVASLWAEIGADQNSDVYSPVDIASTAVMTAFDIGGDTMPEGRVKIIHMVGTVCKIDFAIDESSPYTGLLGPGTSQGFVRMGPGNNPMTNTSGVQPGLGIKLLRSRVQSGNFVAMVSLAMLPDNSYNFMEAPFTNHFPTPFPAGALPVMEKFSQASTCPLKVGLSDLTKFDSYGNQAVKNVFPFKIELRAVYQLKNEPMTERRLLDLLTEVPVDVPLFEVYAYESPTSVAPQKIGEMVPNESCVKSKYGDSTFHVRHQRVEEDWALRPEWLSQMNARDECYFTPLNSVPPQKCSEK